MEVRCFVKRTWKLLPLKNELSVKSQAVLSVEILRELREDHAEAD